MTTKGRLNLKWNEGTPGAGRLIFFETFVPVMKNMIRELQVLAISSL
jgi:hypothetical protein